MRTTLTRRSALFLVSTFVTSVPSLSIAATAEINGTDFVAKASMAGLFEIESSKIALKKSQDTDVKAFAEKMVSDHTAAGKQLAVVAQSNKYKVEDSLDAEHTKMVQALDAASVDNFDNLYIEMQLKGHQGAVALFSAYSQSGDDPTLREFAVKTLPTLEAHHQMIESLAAIRLKKST
jgi:putative membrane protein